MPVSKETLGLYFKNFLALEIFAAVLFTSPGCIGKILLMPFAQHFLNRPNHLYQCNRTAAAQIENIITPPGICQSSFHTVHNIADIGIIPFGFAVAVKRNSFIILNQTNKFMYCQIRTLPGPENRKNRKHTADMPNNLEYVYTNCSSASFVAA